MNNAFYYAVAFLCLSGLQVSGQVKKEQLPACTFRPAVDQELPDSISVLFHKGVMRSLQADAKERLLLRVNPDGSFHFSPSFHQPVYNFNIVFYYHNKVNKVWRISKDYYTKPGDNIHAVYTKIPADTLKSATALPSISLVFSGYGAAMFKVREMLSQVVDDLYKSQFPLMVKEFEKDFSRLNTAEYNATPQLKEYLTNLHRNVLSAIKRSDDSLLKYKSELGSNMVSFFSYELSPSKYFTEHTAALWQRAKSDVARKTIIDFYFANKESVFIEPTDSLVKYTHDYKHNRSLQIMAETDFQSDGKGFPFVAQYAAIKNIRNIDIRDNLLTFFIDQPFFQGRITNNDTKDSCIKDALKIVKSPVLLKYLKQKEPFFYGSQVVDFSFADINDKKTSLADMKGKVFVLDFYFYGCRGCIEFARRFKEEIYPEFANNPDFKVVSVSVDVSRDYWMKALESGRYNEKTHINLSAGDIKWDHPFLKKYYVGGFPFSLLVDKEGKLALSELVTMSSAEISSHIRKALSAKEGR